MKVALFRALPSNGASPTIPPATQRKLKGIIAAVANRWAASEREDELWVRSSWMANEVLAYHRVGSETAQSGWGELRFFDAPMPASIGGGPLPALPKTAVKKATYDYQDERL